MRFLQSFSKEEVCLLNKTELARRFNCDPRTVDRYISPRSIIKHFVLKSSKESLTSRIVR